MRLNDMSRRRALKRRRKLMPSPVRISREHTETRGDDVLVAAAVGRDEREAIPEIPPLQREPEQVIVESS